MASEVVPQKPETIEARARFDLRALWRLTVWGSAAAVALAAAVFASLTENGGQRVEAVVSADLPSRPVATVKIPPNREQEWQIARLETQLRTLTVDRDRLAERVASLEHNLDDITGSIRQQSSQQAGPAPSAAPAPVISSPATTEAKLAEKKAEAATPAAEPQQAVPLPPVRVAALPPEPPKLEFGVALASSSNLDVLHMQWSALKANFGPLLGGLRPIAAREQRGTVTHYRLVLGPLPNAAAATKLCARLTAAHAPCHAGRFSGDPL